jgi:hypothetical protein
MDPGQSSSKSVGVMRSDLGRPGGSIGETARTGSWGAGQSPIAGPRRTFQRSPRLAEPAFDAATRHLRMRALAEEAIIAGFTQVPVSCGTVCRFCRVRGGTVDPEGPARCTSPTPACPSPAPSLDPIGCVRRSTIATSRRTAPEIATMSGTLLRGCRYRHSGWRLKWETSPGRPAAFPAFSERVLRSLHRIGTPVGSC